MSNPYSTIADLTVYGIPATALGALTTAQQQAALDAAAGTIDAHIEGRYSLPLQPPIPIVFTEYCCVIAGWRLMMVRGVDPASPDYKGLRQRFLDAMGELGQIQRQALHPIAAGQSSGPGGGQQPTVLSSSVSWSNSGATAPNRGW